ncbi:MAG: helix-turn-helix domain-containing protein, partial [Oscillospiraceae bacterium]
MEIVPINADLSFTYPAEIVSTAEKSTVIVEEYFLYSYRNGTHSELAGMLNLSIRQTQRFLSQKYGRTFQQLKTESRMSSAQMPLLNSDRTISDIAELFVYYSSEHFCAAF